MAVVSILCHTEFGPNDDREDAPHFKLLSEHLICTGYDEIVVGGCASGRYKDCANSVAHSITCCKSGLTIRRVFKLIFQLGI